MEKLEIEFKEQWILALKGGNYKQSRQALYNSEEDSYCCLGIACLIKGINKLDMINFGYPLDLYTNGVLDDEDKTIPDMLLGTGDDIGLSLAAMNDRGVSFEEIADWITENL